MEELHAKSAAPEINAPGWVSVVLAASLLLAACIVVVSWNLNADNGVAKSDRVINGGSLSKESFSSPANGSKVSGNSLSSKSTLKRKTRAFAASMTLFGPSHRTLRDSRSKSRFKAASKSGAVRLDRTVRLEPVFDGRYRKPNSRTTKLTQSWKRWQTLKNQTHPGKKFIFKSKRRS